MMPRFRQFVEPPKAGEQFAGHDEAQDRVRKTVAWRTRRTFF
jgi:hypothetical protein